METLKKLLVIGWLVYVVVASVGCSSQSTTTAGKESDAYAIQDQTGVHFPGGWTGVSREDKDGEVVTISPPRGHQAAGLYPAGEVNPTTRVFVISYRTNSDAQDVAALPSMDRTLRVVKSLTVLPGNLWSRNVGGKADGIEVAGDGFEITVNGRTRFGRIVTCEYATSPGFRFMVVGVADSAAAAEKAADSFASGLDAANQAKATPKADKPV